METINQENLDQEVKRFLNLTSAVPGNPIKAFLIFKNMSQTTLAKKYNVSPSDISMVITGNRKTKWLRRALAEELNIPEEILFEKLDRKDHAPTLHQSLEPTI